MNRNEGTPHRPSDKSTKARSVPIDHILIIGFGGPREQSEIQPFLEEVTRGRRIPPARLREVAHHYEVIGGCSPYNEKVMKFAENLRTVCRGAPPWAPSNENQGRAQGPAPMPIFVGMRNWHPFLKDELKKIDALGLKNGLGFILAPHRSEASFERYLESLKQAKADSGTQHIKHEIAGPWFRHPLFIDAQTERIREAMRKSFMEDFAHTYVLFSAHSIPHEMADTCLYAQEFETSASLVAKNLRLAEWGIGYQSRSGNPRDPWLEPDVSKYLPAIQAKGYKRLFVVPIGFLCDNAEVLFDLDVELKEKARAMNLAYVRAGTVMDHPKFVSMVGSIIEDTIRSVRTAPSSKATP